MWSKWWQKQARQRRTPAASQRTRLLCESLEERENPTAIFAIGAEAGHAPVVTVFDVVTRAQLFTINAYDASFTGGVRVAVGDVNGDGTGDLITGTGVGGAPIVKVFSGVDGSLLRTLTIGDAQSRNGASVAAADVNGDGLTDLIVGTTLNNQANVQVIQFSDGATIQSFTPFGGSGSAGVSLAAGDFNGDSVPDIAVGAAAGNSPRVEVFAGRTNAVLFNAFAFEQSFLGGVTLAMADFNNDGSDEILASAGTLGGPRVQIFKGGSGGVFQNFFAYDSQQRNGTFASAFDADNNGTLEIVTTDGVGQPLQLKAFNSSTLAVVTPPSLSGLPILADLIGAPTTTIATTSPGPITTSPLTFSVTFSRIMNGFSQSDVTVTGGSVTGFTKTSPTTYTVLVTPDAVSSVSVSVATNVATDAAGNGNAVSNTSTVIIDNTAPAATISSTATSPTNTTPIPVKIVFSEAVTGLTLDDLTITNGAATTNSLTTADNITFTFTVDADGQGPVTVQLPAGKVTDAHGNANAASNLFSITFDTDGPATTVNSTAPAITNTSPIPFSVNFSEDVTGFTEGDLTVTNGTVTTNSFTAQSASVYTFTITPSGQGDVIVSVAAGVATDGAGNANAASAPLTRTYDSIAPQAPAIDGLTAATDTGSSDTDGITNLTSPTLHGVGEIGATVNVSIDNTSAGTTIVQPDGSWTFTPTAPLNEGSHTATATQTDAAGNISSASGSYLFIIDITKPVPVVSTSAGPATSIDPIPFTVNFGEPVIGFTESDITVTAATIDAGSLTDDGGGVYSFTVTPGIPPVTVTVSIAAAAASDIAGNDSDASNTASIDYVNF